jgi:hypothetical protein
MNSIDPAGTSVGSCEFECFYTHISGMQKLKEGEGDESKVLEGHGTEFFTILCSDPDRRIPDVPMHSCCELI